MREEKQQGKQEQEHGRKRGGLGRLCAVQKQERSSKSRQWFHVSSASKRYRQRQRNIGSGARFQGVVCMADENVDTDYGRFF